MPGKKDKTPAELKEIRRKLEVLKQRYIENGMTEDVQKVEKAIKTIGQLQEKSICQQNTKRSGTN